MAIAAAAAACGGSYLGADLEVPARHRSVGLPLRKIWKSIGHRIPVTRVPRPSPLATLVVSACLVYVLVRGLLRTFARRFGSIGAWRQ